MSADSVDPVPVRGPAEWTASARVQASAQLRSRLAKVAIVRDVARVGAEYFHELFDARSVSVTTVEDGLFRELVNVGTLPPPSRWYPKETVYPESVYPRTTQELKDHGGYFTTNLDDLEFVELVGSREDLDVHSVMGVAIVSESQLRGEVFIARDHEREPFDQGDLDASLPLATLLGDSLRAAARRAEAHRRKAGSGTIPPRAPRMS